MSDETTLLPCPFCGGDAEIIETEHSWNLRIEHEQTCFFATQVCGEWTKAEAIAAWNTRTHGTLTAEQVRRVIERQGINDGCIYSVLKGSFKAIADELNATMGNPINEATGKPFDFSKLANRLNGDEVAELDSGTCKPVETETLENVTAHVMECDECGGTYEHVNGAYPRCPHCGAKVVER